jgi:hypothetical protein
MAQIEAYRKDALVALAGRAANRRQNPSLPVYDVIGENEDDDTINTRSAIWRILCLLSSQSVPEGSGNIAVDPAMGKRVKELYFQLLQETAALVAQHWSAIARVAKHLERHDRIDQTELDDLIERGERGSVP